MAVYGTLPTLSLADASERVTRHLNDSIELTNGQRASRNAYKLYAKTRPAASAESCVRAKKLNTTPACHPLFMQGPLDGNSNGNSSENAAQQGVDLAAAAALNQEAAAIAAALQGFRPAATVLEAEVAAPRRGLGAGGLVVAGG